MFFIEAFLRLIDEQGTAKSTRARDGERRH
jgi:hypothetical protein